MEAAVAGIAIAVAEAAAVEADAMMGTSTEPFNNTTY